MEFDLQQFLSEMRQEQREDHAALTLRVNQGFQDVTTKIDGHTATLGDHETRIVVVEGTRKTVRWLAGCLIGAVLAGAADFFFSHLYR